MAGGDVQIAIPNGVAPTTKLLSGNDALEPKSVNAIFDGSAALAPYLPCLVITGKEGLEVARIPASQVAAGASAEVSWFPRVAPAAPAAAAGLDTGMIRRERGGQVIPANVETLVAFNNLQSYHAGTAPICSAAHALNNPITFTKDAVALVNVQAHFATGTGTSRYIRCAFTNGAEASNSDIYSANVEQLGIIAPASFLDLMIVWTFLVYGVGSAGGPFGGPTQMFTYVFQSSTGTRSVGVTQTIMMLPATV